MLRPDKHTNEIINYCLAVAAKRHKIDLIAWMMMSNHYHAVVYDRDGTLPAFTECFHKMVAKAFNHRWERKENLWSSGETNITVLPTQEDVLRKVVYVLTNPAAADLVDSVRFWPGASSWTYMNGAPVEHARPRHGYFHQVPSKRKVDNRRRKSTLPKSEMLRAVPPRASMNGERAINADVWRDLVHAGVRERERELRAARQLEGIEPLGAWEVEHQHPEDSPFTEEAPTKYRPRLACIDKELRRIIRDQLSEFVIAHEAARLRYIAGDHRVWFPAGTYRMRLLGARCKPPPD